jgi:hypothetical protein
MATFTVEGGYDTTHIPAGNVLTEETRRRAGMNFAQTAIDLDACADLREVMLALGAEGRTAEGRRRRAGVRHRRRLGPAQEPR